MKFNKSKIENSEKIPRPVHLWQVDGFVRISDKCREEFEKLIKEYGVRKLSRDLKFDRETIDSIYRKGRKKFIHSISHLIKISKILHYDLNKLERGIISFGRKQTSMYNFTFPFILNPLHIRSISIHGDGSVNINNNQTVWFQKHERIDYMVNLLNNLFHTNKIKSRIKDEKISYVTIPSILPYLVLKSLDIRTLNSPDFFKKIIRLPSKYGFQLFLQFTIDEGHFKSTTFTVSQTKKETRKGFILLLKKLGLKHSFPKNNMDDITIYGFNFPIILNHLNKSVEDYGKIGGFWFKEEQFREISKKSNPYNSYKLVKDRI